MHQHGNTLVCKLPSGREVTIRETNGDDDATLSQIGTALTGENVHIFLANIIVKPSGILAENISKWPINDKYALLYKQRILNHGTEFNFTHIDPDDDGKPEDYTEDLGGITIPDYPYGEQSIIEFVTPTGHKFRYHIMNGEMEDAFMKIPQQEINRNHQLTSRKMEWLNEGKWELLTSFRFFSSKEMAYIRSHVEKNDTAFNPMVSFKSKKGKSFSVPLMMMPTFYFPDVKI